MIEFVEKKIRTVVLHDFQGYRYHIIGSLKKLLINLVLDTKVLSKVVTLRYLSWTERSWPCAKMSGYRVDVGSANLT